MPPSATISAPSGKEESVPARKSVMQAISSVRPNRFARFTAENRSLLPPAAKSFIQLDQRQ